MLKFLRTKLIKIKNLYRKTFNPAEKEINLDSFFKLPLLCFRLIQFDLQPLSESATLRMKVKYFARKCLQLLCLLICIFVPLQFIAFGVVHSDNLDFVVQAISDASATILVALKGVTIMLHKNDIRIIIEELKIFHENRSKGIKDLKKRKYLDEFNRVVKFCIGNFICINLMFIFMWFPYLLAGKVIYVLNLWFPFDEYRLELFPFAQIWFQFIGFLLNSIFITSNLLLHSLITVISMEFDCLKNNLNFVLKSNSKDERIFKMKSFIEHHNKLFELCNKLQQIFEPICLYNCVTSSVIMCIVSFHILFYATGLAMYMFNYLYFIMFSGQIWLLCYFGQKLIDSSIAIADGIYDQDWMDLDDNEFKKYFVIIILRAQRPMRLTAMGFADISLQTFATVSHFCIIF